jgi:hypothetical protein
MKHAIMVLAILSLALGAGCGRETPDMPDGRGTILIAAADTSGFFGALGDTVLVGGAEVAIQSLTSIFTAEATTDDGGVATFEKLATGAYSVFLRREVSVGPNKIVFTGFGTVSITGGEVAADTILVNVISVSNLMINEIHFAGSCASTFYFYDQFVELYNAADDTLYLDGIILTRQLGTKDPDMEIKDYVTAIYAFQFPGTPVTGRQYPILPKQFLVIAADAVNHKLYCANAVDLSHADWECFNALGNDYDVPGVPNVNSAIPGRTTDYLINLSHNAVVIATGEEFTIDENNYMFIPINTVIDGVEYNVNPTYSKELTVRVDAGFAGIGIAKYSGQDTERREVGLDTNNSTFDFVNPPSPTPGYFHTSMSRVRMR